MGAKCPDSLVFTYIHNINTSKLKKAINWNKKQRKKMKNKFCFKRGDGSGSTQKKQGRGYIGLDNMISFLLSRNRVEGI